MVSCDIEEGRVTPQALSHFVLILVFDELSSQSQLQNEKENNISLVN